MAASEEAKKRKLAYDNEYLKKFVLKRTIGFNRQDAEDMKMYNFLRGLKNATQYIKDLIRKDMQRLGL